MAVKKSHEVTFSYLKAWSAPNSKGRKGIWYFDIERQEIRFSSDADRYSFASENRLYVPKHKGERIEAVEKWLSEAERAFVNFATRFQHKRFSDPLTADDFRRIIFAAVSLAYRSGPEVRHIEDLLLSDSELRARYGVTDADSAHIAAVENMVNIITKQAQFYLSGKCQVIYDFNQQLLVCERPMLDMNSRNIPFAVMPLTPSALLSLESNHELQPGLVFVDGSGMDSQLCSMANNFTIERARKWVVAATRRQLGEVRGLLSSERVEVRSTTDRVVFTPADLLSKGQWWELKR